MSNWKSMRRVIVRRSPVHGKGVFALQRIAARERVLEYKGEVTSWREAVRRHQRHGVDGHTFFFGLSDGRVIDGSQNGNSARWLNHACTANCEAIEDAGRVFIETLQDIDAGQELFIEYLLAVDDPVDEDTRRQYACRCGATSCRRSMLADVV
jgi:SET domain-containing protein